MSKKNNKKLIKMKFVDLIPHIYPMESNRRSPSDIRQLIVKHAMKLNREDGLHEAVHFTGKSLCECLDYYIGRGMLSRPTIELIVNLGALCDRLKDGKNKGLIVAYLNHRLDSAPDGLSGALKSIEHDLHKCGTTPFRYE
jgi:hypothetical protein